MLSTCKGSWLVMLLALSAIAAQPLCAEEDNRGTIRGYEPHNHRILIDEGAYLLSKNVSIKNLTGGWSGTTALREGMPIIFNTGRDGAVIEIIILPKDEQKQQELGYGHDINKQ